MKLPFKILSGAPNVVEKAFAKLQEDNSGWRVQHIAAHSGKTPGSTVVVLYCELKV